MCSITRSYVPRIRVQFLTLVATLHAIDFRPPETKDLPMSDDTRRAEAERRLMHLNGEMASLMDQISDLESNHNRSPSEDQQLQDLKAKEEGINQEISDAEADLSPRSRPAPRALPGPQQMLAHCSGRWAQRRSFMRSATEIARRRSWRRLRRAATLGRELLAELADDIQHDNQVQHLHRIRIHDRPRFDPVAHYFCAVIETVRPSIPSWKQ